MEGPITNVGAGGSKCVCVGGEGGANNVRFVGEHFTKPVGGRRSSPSEAVNN